MAHLSNVELVDAMEPGAAPDVVAHLAACRRCRGRADDLSAAMRLAREADQTEPSPLFWPSFAARVSAAIRDDAAIRDRRWWRVPRARWAWSAAGAAAVLLGVAAGLVLQRAPGRPAAPIQVAADRPGAAAGVADTAGPDAELIEGDGTWLLVADAGADVDWDGVSAAGLGPAPGSAVGAVAGLTEAERTELARLLEIVLAGEPL